MPTSITNQKVDTVKIDAVKGIEICKNNIINIAKEKSKRNCVGPQKEELEENFKLAVHQLVDLTAAALVNEIIVNDMYNVLNANVSKKDFPGCSGHVNATIKRYLSEEKKLNLPDNANLTLVDIAKLIETPFTVEEPNMEGPEIETVSEEDIPEPDGKRFVHVYDKVEEVDYTFDKLKKEAYIKDTDEEGKTRIVLKKFRKPYKWMQYAILIVEAFLGLVWDTIKNFALTILHTAYNLVLTVGSAVLNIVGGTIEAGKKLFRDIKSVPRDAEQRTIDAGYSPA